MNFPDHQEIVPPGNFHFIILLLHLLPLEGIPLTPPCQERGLCIYEKLTYLMVPAPHQIVDPIS
jgi:hypothetical protein